MNTSNILDLLNTECTFPEVFEEIENPCEASPRYRRKILHIRADYDSYRWWNTFWSTHDDLASLEMKKEIDAVYEALTSKQGFADLDALRAFCAGLPQARVNDSRNDEYNFYIRGESCLYWLRCITRTKDYHLYLHAFAKTEDDNKCYYDFLDKLRKSGVTNMFGAVPYLQSGFPELSKTGATRLLQKWMDKMSQDKS